MTPQIPAYILILFTRFYKIYFFLPLVLCSAFVYSQAPTLSISGKISDKNKNPLIGATIKILSKDSAYIQGSATNEDGFFKIEDLNPGNYIIKISYVGYADLFLNKQLADVPLYLGEVILYEKSTDMKGVIVKGQINIAEQKGDTTQYNAGAFKTNPDATAEDLVTKMPGITSEDGKLKSGGEEIKQVLVDGKPFFGDDPSAVLKNLPAEVIDKIQVFDQKSSQSQMTGFDDGNTSKTINIITKAQFKNGIFGKALAGYGIEDKYKAGTSINFFKDKRRITILANSNNINEQNFSADDLVGVMSGSSSGGNRRPGGQSGSSPAGGGSRGSGGQPGGQGNDANNFLVAQRNGISTTHAFGINYANSWKKLDFTGSYFLNYTENNSISNLHRQFISNENQGITYDENSISKSQNTNHRANLKFEWKLNSTNSFVFQPRFSFQLNKGTSNMLGENKLFTEPLSRVNNSYNTNLDGLNFSAPIQYKHSFAKKGRSISANINPGYNTNNGNSQLYYYTTNYNDSLQSDTINQTADYTKDGINLSSNVSYSEPINTKSQLLFTYSTNYNESSSNKNTYTISRPNYDETLDSSLSNTFTTNYFSQSIGTSYRYQIDKWNFNGGIAFQIAQLTNVQQFPTDFKLQKSFNSILPNASFQYKFTQQKNLRVSYNSSNNAPSADQLQEVINNKNPLLLTTGNPNLKQDWQNNLNVRYTSIDTKKNTAFFALLGGSLNKNYIVNSTFIAPYDTFITPSILLSRGSQLSKPVNIDGYYNMRSFINYSFPINKIKSKINLNASGSINRTPALINERTNYSNSSNGGLGIAITSNISTKWDFTLSSNSNYNTITNTLQKQLNSSFINQNTRFKLQANPWKGLIIQTELSHQYYKGLSASYNQNFLLWNAAIGYKFLKDKQADLRLSVYDIMKQNNSISRNTTETYYEDVQTNVLQRYFMLTFTYNLKFFKEAKAPDKKPEPKTE